MSLRSVRVGVSLLFTLALAAVSMSATPSLASTVATNVTLSEQSLGRLQLMVDRNPDALAGIAINRKMNTLDVYVSRDRASSTETQRVRAQAVALARTDRSSGQRWRLRFVTVPRSGRELDATMARITSQEPWASASKGLRSISYVDPMANKVHVGVTKLTPALVSAARSTFGDSVEVVQQERLRTQDRVLRFPNGKRPRLKRISPTRASASPDIAGTTLAAPPRLLDSQPYWGGVRIVYVRADGFIIQCTAGFYWDDGTRLAMSTAGHCAANSTQWLQGYYDQASNTIFFTDNMGTVYTVQWGNNRTDAELMANKPYAPAIYTTPNGGVLVGTRANVAVGLGVCADGSFTNENCSGTVTAINTCVDEDDEGTIIHVCGVAIAESSNNTKLVGPGDSGGPVYSPGARAKPAGLISGGNGTGTLLAFSQISSMQAVFGGGPVAAS